MSLTILKGSEDGNIVQQNYFVLSILESSPFS